MRDPTDWNWEANLLWGTLRAVVRAIRDHLIREDDICGLCGNPGADKFPHPIHWPGEAIPETELVHSACEDEECRRAFEEFRSRVGQEGVRDFLRNC